MQLQYIHKYLDGNTYVHSIFSEGFPKFFQFGNIGGFSYIAVERLGDDLYKANLKKTLPPKQVLEYSRAVVSCPYVIIQANY